MMINPYKVYMAYMVILCCLATGYLYFAQYRVALKAEMTLYGYFFLLVAIMVVVMGFVLGAMIMVS